MHRHAHNIQHLLSEAGSDAEVRELSDGARSAAEAAAALGVEPRQIAKSIVFRGRPPGGDEHPVLVIASGGHRVSTKKVKALLGYKVSRADAAQVKAWTGYTIGGIPPLGHRVAPTVLVDETLAELGDLWAAAGTPFAVFNTDFEELLRLTSGRAADIAE